MIHLFWREKSVKLNGFFVSSVCFYGSFVWNILVAYSLLEMSFEPATQNINHEFCDCIAHKMKCKRTKPTSNCKCTTPKLKVFCWKNSRKNWLIAYAQSHCVTTIMGCKNLSKKRITKGMRLNGNGVSAVYVFNCQSTQNCYSGEMKPANTIPFSEFPWK